MPPSKMGAIVSMSSTPHRERQSRQLREQILELRDAAQGSSCCTCKPRWTCIWVPWWAQKTLARWKHPDKGDLSLAAFMPLLEGTEIEVAFGAWVVDAGLMLVKC